MVFGIMTMLFAACLSMAGAHASEPEQKLPLVECVSMTECNVFADTYTAHMQIKYTYDLKDSEYDSRDISQLRTITDQWFVVYQSDPENQLTVSDNKTTKAALEQAGWIVSGAGKFYSKSWYGRNSDTVYKRVVLEGKRQPNGLLYQGLIPGTRYSYYIAFGKEEELYIKTEKQIFSTRGDSITDSSVSGDIVSADNGYSKSRVRFRLINSEEDGIEEYIAGYYCGTDAASLKTEAIAGGSLGYTDDDDYDYDEEDEGLSTVYFPYCPEGSVLYALVYTGTGSGDHLTPVKLDDEQPEIRTAKLEEENLIVSANSVTAGIKATAVVNDPAYDIAGTKGIYCKAYIKEHDQEEYKYLRTNKIVSDEDDRAKWRISGRTAKAEIQFSIGDRIYYENDDECLFPPLIISGDKTYDIKVLIGWYITNDDGTEFHTEYHNEYTELTPKPDEFIQFSEFDAGLLSYLKDRLDQKYKNIDDNSVSAEGIYYTDTGISLTALGRINSIGYYAERDADDDIYLSGYEIKSLKGIKYLTGLKWLCIENLASLRDAQELSALPDLQEVMLSEDHLEHMPDLSGMPDLVYFDLTWNWIPAAEVTADKVPAILASYYDEDELIKYDVNELLGETGDYQYSAETFGSYEKQTKLSSETAAHPFTLHIGQGKLRSRRVNYKTAYYRLEASSGSSAVTPESSQKVFVMTYKAKGMSEEEREEYRNDLMALGIDKVVTGDTAFDFEIGSVAGLTGFGEKTVNYKIYKVSARYEKGTLLEDIGEELLYSGTAQVTYYNKAVVEGLTLSPATKELTVGETATLKAEITPDNADDKTVTWTTSDDRIASVDASGKVTAVAVGKATITATSNNNRNVNGTCRITVKDKTAEDNGNPDDQGVRDDTVKPEDQKPEPVNVTAVSLDKTNITIKKGQEETLTATILPANADNRGVTWTSSDAAVASVTDGKVTATGTGRATVTTTTADGGFTAVCDVLVVDENLDESKLGLIAEEEYTDGYKPADETAKSGEKKTKKTPSVKSGGTVIELPVSIASFQTAVTYIGKKIDPAELGADIDISVITDTITLKEDAAVTAEQLISVNFVPSSNKSAGNKAGFYGKITINREAKKALTPKEYKKLKKEVAAINKELKKKANRCTFTINKRSVTDGTLEVSVQKTGDAIKLKKGKIAKVKNVTLITKDDEGEELRIKLSSKDYKIVVIDAATGLVKVTGKKNFTGTTTVYVK